MGVKVRIFPTSQAFSKNKSNEYRLYGLVHDRQGSCQKPFKESRRDKIAVEFRDLYFPLQQKRLLLIISAKSGCFSFPKPESGRKFPLWRPPIYLKTGFYLLKRRKNHNYAPYNEKLHALSELPEVDQHG
jgi:hypothetical protein